MYASLGKVAVLAMPAATNQAILGVVPDDRRLEATFLRWWLESLEPHVRQFSSSNTQDNLNAETVRNMPLYLPSMFEQRKIADFLDRETERIDALVAKKEHLIELLQEKRTALISHAVTKGLDADAPMKDSGIEWLGEVPEAWQVTPLKHLLLSIEQGWSPQCEERQKGKDEWGVLKAGCANGGKFRDSEHKALPSSLEPDARLEVHQGDVLMSRANTRDLVGAAAFVDTTPPRLLLCDKLYRLRPRTDSLQPRYLAYYLESRLSRYQLERDATGASDSMQNISQTVVRLLALPAPPLPEQCQIVTALDAEMLRLSKLTRLTKLALARLQEYRSALITAAVTGQIDVREYAKEAS
jgi:type I restriction enzyme S subunit